MDFPVFAGRGSLSRMIRQALDDLAALHLVREFIWVDIDHLGSGASEVTVVTPGAPATTEHIERALGRAQGAEVQLYAVNVLGDTGHSGQIGNTQINTVLTRLRNLNASFARHHTNLLFTSTNAEVDEDLPLFDGFRNLLVAPEDSEGPDAGATVFDTEKHDEAAPDFATWSATGIASLAGLWRGFEQAPVARLESNSSARLVRAYFHRISGEKFQQELKSRIFALDHTPVPSVTENNTHVNVRRETAPGQLTQRAAQDFLTGMAREQLLSKEAEAQVAATRTLSVRTAASNAFLHWVRRFFTRPAVFFSELGQGAQRYTKAKVQQVYGHDSRVTIGHSAPAPLTEELPEVPAEDRTRIASELEDVWVHYTGTARSLIDAEPYQLRGREEEHLPGAMRNSKGDITVVGSPAEVIPGPSEHFGSDIPYSVRQAIGEVDVAPYDTAAAQDLAQRLDRNQSSSHQDFLVTKSRFDSWRGGYSHTFANQVGDGLIELQEEQQERRRQAQQRIEALGAEQDQQSGYGVLHGILRWFGWVSFWSLIVVLLLWGYGNFREVDWLWIEHLNAAQTSTKAWMFGIWFLVWLLCYMGQIGIETVHSIRDEQRRYDRDTQIKQAKANLVAAEKSLERCQVGYQQFLSASQLYGALLEKPFGTLQHTQTRLHRPSNQLPAAVSFTEVESESLEALAHRYAQNFYRSGWLRRQIDHSLAAATRQIREQPGVQLHINVHDIFQGQGRSDRGMLDVLARHVSSPEFLGQDRSDSAWAEVLEAIHADPEQLREIRSHRELSSPGFFRQDILTSLGVNKELHDVTDSFPVHSSAVPGDDLGESSITVHAGKSGGRLEDFRLRGGATLQPPAAPEETPRADELDQLFGEGF